MKETFDLVPPELLDIDLENNTTALSVIESEAIDGVLGLQLVSFRIKKSLFKDLEKIAEGKQTIIQNVIREALTKAIEKELTEIYNENNSCTS